MGYWSRNPALRPLPLLLWSARCSRNYSLLSATPKQRKLWKSEVLLSSCLKNELLLGISYSHLSVPHLSIIPHTFSAIHSKTMLCVTRHARLLHPVKLACPNYLSLPCTDRVNQARPGAVNTACFDAQRQITDKSSSKVPSSSSYSSQYQLSAGDVVNQAATNKLSFSKHFLGPCYTGKDESSRKIPLLSMPGDSSFTAKRHMSGAIIPREVMPVTTGEITKFLTDHNLAGETGYTCITTTCPRILRSRVKLRDMEKLYINMKTGYFVCHSCKKSGSWAQLQDNIQLIQMQRDQKKRVRSSCCFEGVELVENTADQAKVSAVWDDTRPLSEINTDPETPHQLQDHLEPYGMEMINHDTLMKYSIHTTSDQASLALPLYQVDGAVCSVKLITPNPPGGRLRSRFSEKIIPRTNVHGLFGWQTVSKNTTDVVITASELDALAVHQATKLPALSLPRGTSNLPQQVLPMLEQFKKIFLWFGNNMRGWEMARLFAKKLNEKRCYLIRPAEGSPSPMTALERGLDLTSILRQSKPVVHKSITSFRRLRQEVFSELLHSDQVAGIQWKRYPLLNSILKGHRRGELTVFTGPTGSGKTTFISDYALDLCMQGVNTLWGSFEINNVRLLKTTLTQFAQVNLKSNMHRFDEIADRFEQLSMYFMTFHGQENVKKVIETMSHAVYVHDIGHIIVDNLQFMMGSEMYTSNDRFLKQDQIISTFRRFATAMNCHVTLVIHPRKERESEDLTTSSIFGSAKASQEADNVLILQDKRLVSTSGRKYIQVTKNRFDGELGIMLLKFNKETLSYMIPPKAPKNPAKKTAAPPKPKSNTAKEGTVSEPTTSEVMEEMGIVDNE